jgi:hypothetical protein
VLRIERCWTQVGNCGWRLCNMCGRVAEHLRIIIGSLGQAIDKVVTASTATDELWSLEDAARSELTDSGARTSPSRRTFCWILLACVGSMFFSNPVRKLACPKCGFIVRGFSGREMTILIGKHSRSRCAGYWSTPIRPMGYFASPTVERTKTDFANSGRMRPKKEETHCPNQS